MGDEHTCDETCGCGPTCLCGGNSICKYNEGTTDNADAEGEDGKAGKDEEEAE